MVIILLINYLSIPFFYTSIKGSRKVEFFYSI
nr:MAG TPA: hypothetical protein [Caudoviricetes sp.]